MFMSEYYVTANRTRSVENQLNYFYRTTVKIIGTRVYYLHSDDLVV